MIFYLNLFRKTTALDKLPVSVSKGVKMAVMLSKKKFFASLKFNCYDSLMIKLAITVIFLCFFYLDTPVAAIYDPTSVPNNRFGIHIVDENDLSDAARLVNSNFGEWGYVKLVIREDDRRVDKWQAMFDRMRRLHLIPIVRLATKVEHSVWVKPRVEDIGSWVDFLGALNWVIENRYVIIFNEPNHAKEWGGQVNPEEYGWYLKEFSRRLKSNSADFFILPAGLDTSADNNNGTLEEVTFIKRMVAKEPDVFDFIDGWTSHSYPQPDYSGNPRSFAKGSVRTFQWELDLLTRWGVSGLPVFITETGWRQSTGKITDAGALPPEKVAENYSVAFQQTWNTREVVAVTPFLLNYQDEPFDHFSWKKYQSDDFHPVYTEIQSLEKISGEPKRHHSARIISAEYPEKLVTGSDYTLHFEIENTGQSLIRKEDGWDLQLEGLPPSFDMLVDNINELEPFHRARVKVQLKTPQTPGSFPYSIFLKMKGMVITHSEAVVTLIPPPSLLISAKLWVDRLAIGSDYNLYVFDENNDFIQGLNNVEFRDGLSDVENLFNIIPNRVYRLVLTKPYYLPRYVSAQLTESKTAVSFPTLLPFDPSNDGALNSNDIGALLKRPLETIGLLLAL